MAISYFEKLKDPRWQKKRLEIFKRDKFTCRFCYTGESTLQVHHTLYLKNTEPWDHPNNILITLCETCHKETTETLSELKHFISNFQTQGDGETFSLAADIIRELAYKSFTPDISLEIYKFIKNKRNGPSN